MNTKLIRIAEAQLTPSNQELPPSQELLGTNITYCGLEDLLQQLGERGMTPKEIVDLLGIEKIKETMGERPTDTARRLASSIIAEAGYDSSAYDGV